MSKNALGVSDTGLLEEQRKDSGREETEAGAGPVPAGPYRPQQSLDFVQHAVIAGFYAIEGFDPIYILWNVCWRMGRRRT